MNADGSHQQRLTRSHAFDGRPNWSPDGTRIAFTHGNYIYVMNANGSGLRQLTKGPSSGVEDDHPAWSPDGTTIAFDRSSIAGPPSEIYVIHADGSGMHRLTRISHFSLAPAWSPDGRRIAFASGRGGISNIYVMRSNGTRVLKLTRSGGDRPAWSPSGHKLAFASDRQEVFHHEIYVMNSEGSGQRRLTRGAAVDSAVLSWR